MNGPDESCASALFRTGSPQDGILVNQILWRLWLLPLGMLVYRSGFLPGLLGVLLGIAGARAIWST